jgi:hypothetical protein
MYDIANNLLEFIRTDADIISYCNTNFGKQPDFLLGLDPENAPANNSLPIVVVSPMNSVNDTITSEHQFMLGIAINDPAIDSIADNKQRNFKGYDSVDKFFKQVFKSVQRFFDGEKESQALSLIRWDNTNFDIYFPIFHAACSITISELASNYKEI